MAPNTSESLPPNRNLSIKSAFPYLISPSNTMLNFPKNGMYWLHDSKSNVNKAISDKKVKIRKNIIERRLKTDPKYISITITSEKRGPTLPQTALL